MQTVDQYGRRLHRISRLLVASVYVPSPSIADPMSLIKAAATERLESMLQAARVRLRTVRGVNLIEIDRDPEIGCGSRGWSSDSILNGPELQPSYVVIGSSSHSAR
jgi:hypothetical protein